MQSSRNVEKMLKLIYADRRSGRPTVYILYIYKTSKRIYTTYMYNTVYIYLEYQIWWTEKLAQGSWKMHQGKNLAKTRKLFCYIFYIFLQNAI